MIVKILALFVAMTIKAMVYFKTFIVSELPKASEGTCYWKQFSYWVFILINKNNPSKFKYLKITIKF